MVDVEVGDNTPVSPKDDRYVTARNRYFFELAPKLQVEIDGAEIFSGPDASSVLQEFAKWRKSGEDHMSFIERANFIRDWRTRLIEAARIDLGVRQA